MKRREFITVLGGAVVAWPRAARSQKSGVPRIGYVWIGARGTDVSNAGLRQGFADLGYVIGRNLVLEERYADGDPTRVPALIAELLALNVDVLLTPGTPVTLAAQRATSTVPIVCVTGDPVRIGLVASLGPTGRQHYRSLAAVRRLQRKVAGVAERGGAAGTSRRRSVEP
jgi:putative ABC transport system substrate-binding protein